MSLPLRTIIFAGISLFLGLVVSASAGWLGAPPLLLGVRVEFVLFTLTLIGVALLHEHTLAVALVGLSGTLTVKWITDPAFVLVPHLHHEAPILINLLGLLLGFAVLANHFERSQLPEILPKWLPDGVFGPFWLLVAVFVLSSFLDNIAAAIIGAATARQVFKQRVHIGYLAAIVACSNGGGSGSVLGDTTTTMMWIDGVAALDVTHAYAAAVPALLICAGIASVQQHRHQVMQKDATPGMRIRVAHLWAVALVLAGAVLANVTIGFPAAGVWIALVIAARFASTHWQVAVDAIKGSLFLLSLVLIASMMPVAALPAPSWQSTLGLGFVSAIFDNIPLTKLALDQGGYDWGMLAFAVGYGGSMMWFGSSAGVAVAELFPAAKSVGQWLRHGWHVVLAYVIGFTILLATWGWNPHPIHRPSSNAVHTTLP